MIQAKKGNVKRSLAERITAVRETAKKGKSCNVGFGN